VVWNVRARRTTAAAVMGHCARKFMQNNKIQRNTIKQNKKVQ